MDLEETMKRLLTVLMAGLLVAAFVVPAMAWEFSMTGEYEFRLRYVSRTGDTDLFGVAPLQDAVGVGLPPNTAVGFAGPNWYNMNLGTNQIAGPTVGARVSETLTARAAGGLAFGAIPNIIDRQISAVTAGFTDNGLGRARIVRGGYSTYGCDALYADSRLTLRPVIRVNPAIRVHGVYTVGGMRHKWFQNYINGFGMGIGTPPLERYYMSQTSMNAYDTAALGSWEQFRATIQLPIGIFSIGVKDFPFGTGASLGYNTRAEAFLTVLPYGPFRFLHGIWLARGRFSESWNTRPDKDSKATLFQGVLMTYDCGAFQFGAGAIWRMAHLHHGEMLNTPGVVGDVLASVTGGLDTETSINLAYFKYNNGRFFAAAEYAWAQADIHFLTLPGGVGGRVPLDIEAYHWFSEAGAVAGPAKVRLLYALASGYVLNNGNATKSYRPWAINYQALAPYQYLMFEVYAGGNNGGWNANDIAFVSDDHGQMTDAYCFGARADYAVASNLNVWASYLWAHRLERAGYFAGGTAADGGVGNASVAAAQAWKAANGFGANANPYVDDGHIGWEADAGIDWKLLEGLNMFVRYAYWQPGKWFDQAYQAVGGLGAGGGLATNALVTGRDAIHAINGSFIIDF